MITSERDHSVLLLSHTRIFKEQFWCKDQKSMFIHEHSFLSFRRLLDGGAKEDRTPDLLRAKQALSQLSYGPVLDHAAHQQLVGLGRFELPTSPLSGVRSNQLSYRPNRLTSESSNSCGSL